MTRLRIIKSRQNYGESSRERPLEAVRANFYARKEKTNFVLSDHTYVPIYSPLLGIPYPDLDEILERITPFSKERFVFPEHHLAKKELGDMVYGNTVLIGAAVGLGLLPLREENVRQALEVTVPRGREENLKAFRLGLELAEDKRQSDDGRETSRLGPRVA